MFIVYVLLTTIVETAVVRGIKKWFTRKQRPFAPKQIPLLHTLSQQFAGVPNKYEKIVMDKTIIATRKMVDTTTFEHLVSGLVSHNSKLRKELAKSNSAKGNKVWNLLSVLNPRK
jgi:tRNA A37 threonylcarbamoyltransferase TsaD